MPAAHPQVASAPRGNGPLVAWSAIVVLTLVILGGIGYWGWNNKVARDEAVQKLASEQDQQHQAAEKSAADAAEIRTAQLLLEKHIAAEEAEAQARAR
jgi:cytoskeletal protein RodZ